MADHATKSGPHGGDGGEGKPVTFDQMDFTTYLYTDSTPDHAFTNHLILQVNGFELNGSPVNVPGFGSKFGMYFLIDATGHNPNGVVTFDTMNIALMVDRGNNDGAPSSTLSGGVTFANGTQGDFALATGTLVSGTVDNIGGVFHPHLVQLVSPTEAGEEIFGKSLDPRTLMQELLTTPGGPVTTPVGADSIQIVNGTGANGAPATGIADLVSHAPLTMRPGELNEGFHGCGF